MQSSQLFSLFAFVLVCLFSDAYTTHPIDSTEHVSPESNRYPAHSHAIRRQFESCLSLFSFWHNCTEIKEKKLNSFTFNFNNSLLISIESLRYSIKINLGFKLSQEKHLEKDLGQRMMAFAKQRGK